MIPIEETALITGDNCTNWLQMNLDIVNSDINYFKFYLILAVCLLLFNLYLYFKAYARMVGYVKK